MNKIFRTLASLEQKPKKAKIKKHKDGVYDVIYPNGNVRWFIQNKKRNTQEICLIKTQNKMDEHYIAPYIKMLALKSVSIKSNKLGCQYHVYLFKRSKYLGGHIEINQN